MHTPKTNVGKLSLLLLLWGCTRSPQGTSPDGSEIAGGPEAHGPPKSYLVEDLQGKWSSTLEGLEAPKVSAEPGYWHTQSLQPEGGTLHCFVYQEAFDAGQALTRLLRASEVGIEYDKVELARVEARADAPLLFLRAGYRRTEGSAKGRGVLQVAMSPRWDFPVVCTFEHETEAFERRVLSFLESFEVHVGRKWDRPVVSEVWRLSRGEKPLGFSLLRLHEKQDGTSSALEVSATFDTVDGRLRTTDSVALEQSDAQGVASGKWLHIEGTTAEFSLILERQEFKDPGAFSFRYAGSRAAEPLRGEFSTKAPLETALSAYRRLSGEEPALPFTVLRYRPLHAAEGPTLVQYRLGASPATLEVEAAGLLRTVTLGAQGLPESEQFGDRGAATLLSRTGRGLR